VEIFETFSMARWASCGGYRLLSLLRTLNCIAPLAEYAEYHPFHREKVPTHHLASRLQVELYMAELYNKIGSGLITWSPVSLGLCSGKSDDQAGLFTRLAVKSGKYNGGGPLDMMALSDGKAPHEAVTRVKQLEAIADRLGASLTQLVLAWSLRNNTSQVTVVSASSVDQLARMLHALQLLPKLTNSLMDEVDRVLGNKPVRPAMVSTLQQRWAATGGMPPQ
jgi:aryl-alcohol dehydrogenase-like predicted oxidoreductase